MSDQDNKKDDKNKKSNDPYDFFKLDPNPNGKKDNKEPNGGKKKRFPFWGMLMVILAVLLISNMFFRNDADDFIDFSVFQEKIESGEIVRVEMGETVFIGYTEDAAKPEEKPAFDIFSRSASQEKTTVYRTNGVLVQKFLDLLDSKNVTYSFVKSSNNYFLQILINLLIPFIFIAFLYFFIFRKMGGGGSGMGGMSMFGVGGGKSKAIEEGKVKTRFADVAGVDEAKEELVEVVDFLKEPRKYTEIGGKIPKGVLLVGPPGTGKTLLARAVAGEAGVPFFRISGSDFVEMFVGVGASRVRDLFRQAREKAPCIVFIDEIDALGKNRMNGFGGGNDEREQTLNQLLVEMDGFDNEKGLIILAATNRADILDPALLRPGRFDRRVPVEKPDVKGREEILRIHSKNVKLDEDVDFISVAHGTSGFAGADLANVVNEAALLAVRNGRKKVSMEDFNDAIDKVSIGLKKKTRKENEKERLLVAYHETGHALMGAFTPDYPPVNKITIVPRSNGVGGFTQYREKEESFLKTRKDMIGEVDTLLGGRAAEKIMLGDISTGASNDISFATDIIKSMIVDYGMSEKFSNMTLGKGVRGHAGAEPELIREFSEDTQKYIDEEIARIMNERYTHVLNTLSEHKELLEYIARRLLEKETMEGKEFEEIVKAENHCAALTQEAIANLPPSEEKPAAKTSKRTIKKAEPKAEKSEKKSTPKKSAAKKEQ